MTAVVKVCKGCGKIYGPEYTGHNVSRQAWFCSPACMSIPSPEAQRIAALEKALWSLLTRFDRNGEDADDEDVQAAAKLLEAK